MKNEIVACDAELTKANLIIGQFINSCSHSMRGPLKSILGLVNVLNNNTKHADATDSALVLSLIETSVEKMEKMLDQLEHFLENSKRNLSVEAVIDLKSVVNVLLKKFAAEILHAGLKIQVVVRQSAPIFSDVSRLRVIVDHLLQNSITFCAKNDTIPVLKIEIIALPKALSIIFTDNGVGIHQSQHLKVFDLFYRGTEKSTGTGLGLYVVQEIVHKLGGEIKVSDRKGNGTIFTITIPNSPLPIDEIKPAHYANESNSNSERNLTRLMVGTKIFEPVSCHTAVSFV
jgi:signal transduction histidine kinase